MKIDGYLHLLPEIEASLRHHQLDAIVWGMGPTGWLLPWVNQSLLRGVRLWTCHDGCRIMPAHDVVVMDAPVRALHPDTSRYQEILRSRPQRFWVYNRAWEIQKVRVGGVTENVEVWKKHLPKAVHEIVNVQNWRVWNPELPPKIVKPVLGHRTGDGKAFPDTMLISPTGTVTLAWEQGARRIGVIGVDMMKDHHHTYANAPQVDAFFCCIAKQAEEQGGLIVNLSPVTSLKGFKQWKNLSASSSAPTSGSTQPAPNESSNTASGSTQPVPSTSDGCAVELKVSKSAN